MKRPPDRVVFFVIPFDKAGRQGRYRPFFAWPAAAHPWHCPKADRRCDSHICRSDDPGLPLPAAGFLPSKRVMDTPLISHSKKDAGSDDPWPVKNRVELLGSPPDSVGAFDNARGPTRRKNSLHYKTPSNQFHIVI